MDEHQKRFCISHDRGVEVIEISIPEDLESMEFDAINIAVADAIRTRGKALWVLDLANVGYAGSALLGLLINIRTTIRRSHGTLVICAMHESIERVLQAGSMERLFVVARTRDEAILAML